MGVMDGNREVVSDRAVGSVFVIVPMSIFQLSAGISKAHEPMRVQTFRPQLAVERFDEPVVGRFRGREKSSVTSSAWPRGRGRERSIRCHRRLVASSDIRSAHRPVRAFGRRLRHDT